MASPRLDKLAAELIVEIARYLWLGDMSHLARVNRWLYQVLDPLLYLTDAKPYNQYALFWAAEHNLLTVAERALRAGTPVQPHTEAPSRLRPFGRVFLTEQELSVVTPRAPLVIAAAAGHCAITTLLLRDPRLMDSLVVKMAIDSAAAKDQVEMVDMLLWHVEHEYEESLAEVIHSAFHQAASQENIAVIELLSKSGAGLVGIPRDEYSYYQMQAAGTGHDELWDLFSSIQPLELVPDHSIQSEHLLYNLNLGVTGKGSRGIVELVETFTSLGFDWKRKGELARILEKALKRDKVPLVELLLSYSSDVQKELETLFASSQGARLFLSIVDGIPAYIRDRGGEMLKAACSMGFLELAQLVLSPRSAAERRNLVQDAEPKLTEEEHLLFLLMNHMNEREGKRLEIARLVLEAGADPNPETPWSNSPLRTACEVGLARLARLLLEYGADPVEATPAGYTILHVACRYCPNLALIEELLKRGADAMARDDNGTTPLHELCVESWDRRDMGPMAKYQVAKLLISNGADPNAMKIGSTTPLQAACSNKSPGMDLEDAKVVFALLEHGVDIDQLGSGYKSPLFIACSNFNHSVASILLEQGAERSSETLRGFAQRCTFGLMSDEDLNDEDLIDEDHFYEDVIDGDAHKMAKLLLSHGVDRVLVRQEMMNFLGHRLYGTETVRLLLMHGTNAGMDEPIFLQNGLRGLRTEALAEALGMIKEDELGFRKFSWPTEN